ncbi:uncharacterized protein LOC113997545 [Pipra filicauda]|uniref:Uncharacterized protein LOC113997545 n=1 Tax=Pipra filicauda TaxID=649802 RepID=A0A7R5K527_9PASS|nr:uncharacterized protein LOC113997545 [Pipra filicauda]
MRADGTPRPGDAGTHALPAASRPCAERPAGAGGTGTATHTHKTTRIFKKKKKKKRRKKGKAPGMPEEAGRGARMPHRCCRAGPAPRLPPTPLQGFAGEGGGAPGAQRPAAPGEGRDAPAALRGRGSPGSSAAGWRNGVAAEESQGLAQTLAGFSEGLLSHRSHLCCWGCPAATPEGRRVCVKPERAGACGSPGAGVATGLDVSGVPSHGRGWQPHASPALDSCASQSQILFFFLNDKNPTTGELLI